MNSHATGFHVKTQTLRLQTINLKKCLLKLTLASERIKIGLLGDWWLLLYSEMLKKLFQLKFRAFS